MPGILIYSEDNAVVRQLITAGLDLKAEMNEPVCVITLNGEEDKFFAAGADKVFVLKGENAWPESFAGVIAELVSKEQANVILVGGTARGKDVAAKVAALLKAGLVTEAQSVIFTEGHIETTRLMYGGLAVSREAVALPALVTIAPRTYDEPAATDRQGEVVIVDAPGDTRVIVNNVCPIERQGVDIATADRIVCVGRGLSKKEDLSMVEDLAKALGAEVACTRSIAEDYHWLPIDRYIGISGQKVKPELYLAMGISGQVQHVSGMRDSKVIIAVDTNEKAPIFDAADYGIVGDMYEVIPLLTAALKK